MFSKWFPKKSKEGTASTPFNQKAIVNRPLSSGNILSYNWILSNKLAIGPMPQTSRHWQQLEMDGFINRFSCCYPYEHIFAPIPGNWSSKEVSLPDHRQQEILKPDTLIRALVEAESMLRSSQAPLYLHCFAGQERSVLVAIGILSIVEKMDLFDSLNYVRQCHKKARPIYSQLDLLDQVLKERY